MKVRWTPQAEEQLNRTALYIQQTFGQRERVRFQKAIYEADTLLATNPRIGTAEPLLADRSSMYRSLVVNRLNKIVYRICDDHIEIDALWDTRREPTVQANIIQ